MKRFLRLSICAALALAALPSAASFRLRLPRRAQKAWGGLRAIRVSAPDIPAYPEGTLVYSCAIPGGEASFALYQSGLQPDDALAAAAVALAAAGWTQVFVFGQISLFENSSGNCAAVQAMPADGGATAVSFLVAR